MCQTPIRLIQVLRADSVSLLRSFDLVSPIFGPFTRGTAEAEIKVPSAENPELSAVLSVKPGGGQNIVLHVSPAARNSA